MAGDLFGGLGGLMKGLSNFMPQDDPAVKQLNLQTEISDLKKQETDLYAQIGKQALQEHGDGAFPDIVPKLRLIQQNLRQAESSFSIAKAENAEKEKAEQEAKAQRTCPNCGTVNEEGVKFCNECGTKLGAPSKLFCTQCGAENAPGTRFCGECGAKMPE